jgi:hypothetical protein
MRRQSMIMVTERSMPLEAKVQALHILVIKAHETTLVLREHKDGSGRKRVGERTTKTPERSER